MNNTVLEVKVSATDLTITKNMADILKEIVEDTRIPKHVRAEYVKKLQELLK